MPSTVPIPLTPSARRAQAAATLHTATALPELTCVALADALDAVCAGFLRSTGCDDDAARMVLGDLWKPEPVSTARRLINGRMVDVPMTARRARPVLASEPTLAEEDGTAGPTAPNGGA